MARRTKTPERSKIVRPATSAAARRQRGSSKDGPDDEDGDAPAESANEPTVSDGKPYQEASTVETQPHETSRPDPKDLPAIEPPEPRAEPWPDATPPPMRPVPAEGRPHSETIAAPTTLGGQRPDFGRPPEMPKVAAPPPLVLGDVENPAHLPGPREVPSGNPDDPAPAPGHVPPGDSRSLRRGTDFALIYRVGTCVITRFGRIGTRGQWRVVEYPTSAAASNSYAKECSRFVSEGFSDYRD